MISASDAPENEKRRKIGVRILSAPASHAITADHMAQLYDIESGDIIDGVFSIELNYTVGYVIEAHVKLYVQAVDAKP